MSPGGLVVVGDALLDVDVCGTVTRQCPDAPAPVLDVADGADRHRPGGAALAAVLATADSADGADSADTGGPVTLVTALGDPRTDPATRALSDALEERVVLRSLRRAGTLPTKTRLRDRGTTLARVDRGGLDVRGGCSGPDGSGGPADDEAVAAAVAAIEAAGAVLVSDYGRGVADEPRLRAAVARAAGRVPVVWDPHPRGPCPVPGVGVVCPNDAEAVGLVGHGGAAAAATLCERWAAAAVAVTVGEQGAVLVERGGPPLVLVPDPGPIDPDRAGAALDTCGAGDRFAAALVTALIRGADPPRAVRHAVDRASAWVRSPSPTRGAAR